MAACCTTCCATSQKRPPDTPTLGLTTRSRPRAGVFLMRVATPPRKAPPRRARPRGGARSGFAWQFMLRPIPTDLGRATVKSAHQGRVPAAFGAQSGKTTRCGKRRRAAPDRGGRSLRIGLAVYAAVWSGGSRTRDGEKRPPRARPRRLRHAIRQDNPTPGSAAAQRPTAGGAHSGFAWQFMLRSIPTTLRRATVKSARPGGGRALRGGAQARLDSARYSLHD